MRDNKINNPMQCNAATLCMIVLLMASVLVLSGCFNSLVNSPRNSAMISKLLSQTENKVTNTIIVNLPSHQIYPIVENILTKKDYVVKKYKFNPISKQYHNNELYSLIWSPDNSRGAVIASKINYTSTINRITIVYIQPAVNDENSTTIKVAVSKDKSVDKAALLNAIITELGELNISPKSAPVGTPTDDATENADDTTGNPAQDAADAALEALDEKLAE